MVNPADSPNRLSARGLCGGIRNIRRFSGLLILGIALVPLRAQTSGAPAAPLWRQALGGAVIGLPAAQAESVVVVCDGGNLKCYSREGKFLWDYYARGRLVPYVTRSREGTSYICGTNGTLIAINRSGRELWRFTLGSPLSAPILPGWDGRIFVSTREGLSCFTASGYRLWSKVLARPMAVNPIPDRRGGLVTVLEDGELLAIDAFGGTRSRRLSGVPLVIAAAEGGILVCHTNGTAELVGLQTGEKAPPLPPLPGFPLAALTRGDRAALAFADGRVLLLSLSEGRVLWTGESHVTVPEETAMLYDERGIYVLTASGASGFTEDGRRLWILRLMGAASLPAFSDEGILYSGGTDWILYAYKLEERRRIQNRSLYGPAPLGSYGVGNPPPFPRDDYYLWFEETELRTRLGSIAGAIAEGRVGEQERAFAACLMWTAGTTPLTPGTGPWIRERLEAIRLLGYMGSRETIPFLAELFQQDPEPVIRAASAEAIGRIGVDPDGLAIGVFTRALFSPAQDERLLLAIARATGALCRFSGPPLSDTGIRILTALGAEDLPPVVQREARRELASLR